MSLQINSIKRSRTRQQQQISCLIIPELSTTLHIPRIEHQIRDLHMDQFYIIFEKPLSNIKTLPHSKSNKCRIAYSIDTVYSVHYVPFLELLKKIPHQAVLWFGPIFHLKKDFK